MPLNFLFKITSYSSIMDRKENVADSLFVFKQQQAREATGAWRRSSSAGANGWWLSA